MRRGAGVFGAFLQRGLRGIWVLAPPVQPRLWWHQGARGDVCWRKHCALGGLWVGGVSVNILGQEECEIRQEEHEDHSWDKGALAKRDLRTLASPQDGAQGGADAFPS